MNHVIPALPDFFVMEPIIDYEKERIDGFIRMPVIAWRIDIDVDDGGAVSSYTHPICVTNFDDDVVYYVRQPSGKIVDAGAYSCDAYFEDENELSMQIAELKGFIDLDNKFWRDAIHSLGARAKRWNKPQSYNPYDQTEAEQKHKLWLSGYLGIDDCGGK